MKENNDILTAIKTALDRNNEWMHIFEAQNKLRLSEIENLQEKIKLTKRVIALTRSIGKDNQKLLKEYEEVKNEAGEITFAWKKVKKPKHTIREEEK